MKRSDLVLLSRLRRKEARFLLNHGYYSASYYLCGYSVELALKAAIAKRINRHEIPEKKMIEGVFTHDLNKLIGIAGLVSNFNSEVKNNQAFETNWAITKDWKPDVRYQIWPESVARQKANELYSAVANPQNGVLKWLRQHY